MTLISGAQEQINRDPGEESPVVIVTGMSGAGRSTALKALEDLGYEAVDNLPLSLLSNLLSPGSGGGRPLAIGVDARTRDFGAEPFIEELDALITRDDLRVRLLFLDCAPEVLQRRFSETRRRHPVTPDRRVTDGIRGERHLLSPLRDRADEVIETTDMETGDLKRLLDSNYALEAAPGLAIFITSFAYRRGLPHEADLVFDVRFLKNPHYEDGLRALSGQDAPVGEFIEGDPDFGSYFGNLTRLLEPLLPRFSSEGKSYLTIAVGCTGGKHRSVYVAEKLKDWLNRISERVMISHRDLSGHK
ncbi:MAG: Nucleotide-binding protein [Alphaproteobacteria bacterium MarineAlpha11_Bin1]|nr:MAG: Nucleotide-binding protein [Alphaproteobacteria bacterium MarineAlpha11_Bin1]|tara:strand:- start:2256 stop:3164 length:909 start_codon:yes stop_codon:yes gene_type:complete